MPEFREKARVFLRDKFRRTLRSGSRTHSPSLALPGPPPPPPITSASTSLGYAIPSKPTSALGTTGSVIHELLATARDGADLCLPLKAALVGVVKIWDICERTSRVKEEYLRANSKLAHLHKIAIAYGKDKELDEKLQKRLDEISGALNQLTTFAQEKETRGLVLRVLESSEDVATVKGLLEKVSSLLEVFQFESIVSVELRLKEVLRQLAAAEEQRVAAEEKRALAKDQVRYMFLSLGAESHAQQEKVMKTIKTVLGDNFVSDAAHDEQPIHAGCMPGTREVILNKLVAWVLTDPMAIFWLAEMAGTGKTSIAVTLSRMLQVEPGVMMGGGFFCSRSAGSIARTDVRRVIPTLAGLLAGKSPEFARALAAELEEDPRVGHKPVTEQVGTLLRKPLAALSTTTIPLVFVIDALDECHDQTELAQLIKEIAEFESDANVKVKFMLTSRPEMHIRGTPIADSRYSSILRLHTISEAEVTSDIRLYIERTLEDCSPDASWYNIRDVEALLKLASGLFIFASTVMKYILARGGVRGRAERLKKATAAVGVGTTPTATIDKIYEMVIVEASQSGQFDTNERQEVKRVLACILTARTSLSVQALAELMAIQAADLRESLERLHSVVYIPSEDAEPGLRTLHASFGDFLYDADRAPPIMHIDAALGHNELAHGCLARMMQSDLCFNISHSESSHKSISQLPRVDWIPLSLIYACIQWAHHIQASSDILALEVSITKCFRPKLLFWLEAMVVFDAVDLSAPLLRIASLTVYSIELKQFLRDAASFVEVSYSAMETTPPHIYLSALPFTPKDSLVYQDFSPLCTNVISVETKGIDRHAGNPVMVLISYDGKVNSIAYSPDGLFLTSGSDDGTVRLWHTPTGQECIQPLRSSDGNVTAVAFSPDSIFIVIGTSDGPIHVWDIRTGQLSMMPLLGHNGSVACVTFAPDGKFIASAGADHLVRLWNAEMGQLLAAMEGHTEAVNIVAFNPEGNILVSCSDDGDVLRWDVHTRKRKDIAFSQTFSNVISLVFSPDGSTVAAGFGAAQEIRLWDANFKSEIVSVIKTEVRPNTIAFSSDSQHIFTPGANGIVSWNWRSGQRLSTIFSGSVNTISCPSSGPYIASTSGGRKIYIWDTGFSQDSVQNYAHSSGMNAVALSVDGCTIASASEDGTVGLWDARSGEAILPPLLGHRRAVNSVLISPNGRLVVSASADSTIRIWDIATGAPVGEPLRGHKGSINALAFSPDGMWLASAASDRSVRFWQISLHGAPSAEPPKPLRASRELYALAYSPDGSLIAAGAARGKVWVWQTTQNEGHRRILGWSKSTVRLRSVAFSPDGNFIVRAFESRICAWHARIQDYQVAWELEGHLGVSTVQFSSSGQHIVSGADDGSICIWDAETRTILHRLHAHGASIRSAFMTPDHLRLVSCSEDGTIRVWNLAEVTLPVSQTPLSNLALVPREDGWLVGASDELHLWVPQDYINNLVIDGTTETLIAKHKVVLTIPDGGSWDGTNWTKCWRG